MAAKTNIRDILNAARWRDQSLHTLQLTVVHRGAPNDRRSVGGSRIVEIGAGGIALSPTQPGEDGVFLPYHRFLSITTADGATIWDKARGMVGVPSAAPLQATASEPAPGTDVTSGNDVTSGLQVTLPDTEGLLTIDGSAGEGGGQIVRSSLSLSLLTGKPFIIDNIRGKRRKPGLMRQHLTCVRAAAEISDAEVEGAELRSSRLVFRPGKVRGGSYRFDIGSAGATSLVLQTLALPLALADTISDVTVTGGTHAKWAPPYPFLEQAWLPLMRRMGIDAELQLKGAGFYPAGGGRVVLTCQPSAGLLPLTLPRTPGPQAIEVSAVVANLSESVARRELTEAAARLGDTRVKLSSATVRSHGPGNACWLTARGDAATNVFSVIGDKGLSAEEVGAGVVEAYRAWQSSGGVVDEHLADQLMVPVAIAGGGSFTTSALSLHSWTNIEVIAAFTGARLRVERTGDLDRVWL